MDPRIDAEESDRRGSRPGGAGLEAAGKRPAIAAVLAIGALAVAPARADIVAATGTATVTISESDMPPPMSMSGAVPGFPGVFSFGAGIGPGGGLFDTVGFGAISDAFVPPPANTFVFIPSSGPASSPSYVSQAALPPGVTSTTEIDFSVTFTTDASGLPALHLSLAYPILSIISPSQTATFMASISYMEGATPLGTQTLLYTAPIGVTIATAVGSSIDLPALGADASLTLSGMFKFTLTSGVGGGPPSEIKTLGVPEPSSLALMATAALGIAARATARRSRREPESILGRSRHTGATAGAIRRDFGLTEIRRMVDC